LSLVPQGCIAEAIELLTDIERRLPVYSQDWEAKLNLEQNAWIVVDAERYYRTMMKGGATSWNVRDRHMMSTLMRLEDYHGEGTRSIVWAHNTHIGDARATDMASTGMLNIGQLARERFGLADTHLVGLGSYTGSVVAARGWGEERETMIVPAASPGTWEGELHAALGSDRVLGLSRWRDAPELMTPRGHRAIGVVYHPEREHLGNFVPTVLPLRYDSFLYLEETNALHAVAVEPRLDREPPETYPFGLGRAFAQSADALDLTHAHHPVPGRGQVGQRQRHEVDQAGEREDRKEHEEHRDRACRTARVARHSSRCILQRQDESDSGGSQWKS
jgi:hypothetical protein